MTSQTFANGYQLDYVGGAYEIGGAITGETVTDDQDGNANGQTAVGDNLTSSYGGGSTVTLIGTTANGVVVENGGAIYLYTNATYALDDPLIAFNTTDPYNYCFLTGTMIATPSGETPVEHLKIGDEVLTADGRTVPVKWMGEQRIKNWRFTGEDQMPVVIAEGALGEGLPHTDLYVSASHGMIVEGHVINAAALVNGTTIRFASKAEMASEFTFYHIETEAHEEVLANGAAAETFIDSAARTSFDNHQEYLDLYGTERIIPEMPRPRITSSRLVPECVKTKIGGMDWDAALASDDLELALAAG